MSENDLIVIGGLDESEDSALPDRGSASSDPDDFFSHNAFRIIYQTNNFFLPQIRDLIDKGEVLNLRPEYQRRLRWSNTQKSRLIESLLLNIPIPSVYLYESDAARYEVMDGQQRLNAVREFVAGDFALTGLQVLKPLNTLRYYRCPPRIKRFLDRSSLSAIVLLLESEPASKTRAFDTSDIRRFIFDRLNTGGTKLNPQEIRNAIYPGAFNKVLVDLSRYRLFTDVFDIPAYIEASLNEYYENESRQKNTLYASMADCQLVLRYFALRDDENIRGSMRSMLDRAMEQRVKMTEDDAASAGARFKERFSFLYDLFDKIPFRLPPDERGRERVSAALYDASMVALDRIWDRHSEVMANKTNVQQQLKQVMLDPEKLSLLTGQANTAQAVKDRIALMSKTFIP